MDKRLARGDIGINALDAGCREHDIAYANHSNSDDRHKADLKLKSLAKQRIFARDSSFGERLAATAVSAAMGVKTRLSKIGGGLRRAKNRVRRRRKLRRTSRISFVKLLSGVRKDIKRSNPKTLQCAVKAALKSANKLKRGKQVTSLPRIIKVPSFSGGMLPIVPILSGLAAVGSLASTVANVVHAIKAVKKNEHMANNAKVKIGHGLYLSSHGGAAFGTRFHGNGLYLKPFSKN